MYNSTFSLTFALDAGGWSSLYSGRCTGGTKHQRYRREGVPHAGINICGNSHTQLGCDPQTVHHIASLYTNYVIPKVQ